MMVILSRSNGAGQVGIHGRAGGNGHRCPTPVAVQSELDGHPHAGLAGGGSNDYGAGSLLYIGGLTSLLSYDFGQFNLTMGNHLSAMKAISTDVGGYDVGGDLDQQILKNGLKLAMPFSAGG